MQSRDIETELERVLHANPVCYNSMVMLLQCLKVNGLRAREKKLIFKKQNCLGNDNVKQSSMHVNRCRQNISTGEQNFHEALLTVMHGCFIFH